MATTPAVRYAANFERNLDEVRRFLIETESPRAFDDLLDELLDTVVPNLERFPRMGRPFLQRRADSVEGMNALAALQDSLTALTDEPDAIRECVLKHYLLLYAIVDGVIYLLAIRHQRQLSFDFPRHWG